MQELNDEGAKILVNLDTLFATFDASEDDVDEYFENCGDTQYQCIVQELVDNYDKPKFSPDDRWTPEVDKESFNEMLSERLDEIDVPETNLAENINEDIESEIKKLESIGYKLIDKYSVGSFTLMLVYNPDEKIFEIGLTSGQNNFTTFGDQIKKPSRVGLTTNTEIKSIKNKLIEWLTQYKNNMVVGTMNSRRAQVYKNLLSGLGFNTTSIKRTEPDEDFDESWEFNLSIPQKELAQINEINKIKNLTKKLL